MSFSVSCVLYLLAAFAFGTAFGTWIGRRVAEKTIAKNASELTDDEISRTSRAYWRGVLNGRKLKSDDN